MPDHAADDDRRGAGESPILVRVTVEAGPRDSAGARPLRLRGLLAPIVGLVAVALLAGVLVNLGASQAPKAPERPLQAPQAPQPPQASDAGPVGVAAAYRYPRACLSVTIAAADPTYAAVRLNRASPCWRMGAYSTTIFHRVAGVWRIVLQAPNAGCPGTQIPAPARAQLGLC